MLDNTLIKKSLALTGKTIDGIEEVNYENVQKWDMFSIEKFSYFLLSPEFIEKYSIYYLEKWLSKFSDQETSMFRFAKAIYEYQSWNESPLVELLNKI